MEEMIFISL